MISSSSSFPLSLSAICSVGASSSISFSCGRVIPNFITLGISSDELWWLNILVVVLSSTLSGVIDKRKFLMAIFFHGVIGMFISFFSVNL